ncbi:TetR/AcrR family transcriptional regulator [Nocardioides immobilis]|uniref:TetR/AcrR family transcriptional regulator n=1 Tax=Nocardioides immobilis TaxID=2049295 RepID=A0A417XXF9_9ACTN|nr:TetR/AcrR family transcriptional regulator [Nocardioides immobilis]
MLFPAADNPHPTRPSRRSDTLPTAPGLTSRPARAQAVDQLVDATIRLLATEGPSQIKARSVAAAAQLSTSAVYYHVGGIPELFQAVVDRGFAELARAFDSTSPSDDPVADLFGMALATRHLAQSNPHLYDLMFGLSTRGSYRPSEPRRDHDRSEAFRTAYARLVQTATRLISSGRVRADEDPELIADQLWSCVHGFVTLELAGHFTQLNDPVRERLQPLTVCVFVGHGDTAERASASHDSVRVAPPTAVSRVGPDTVGD